MALFELTDVVFKDLIHYPDLRIAAGRVTAVVGESGAGKTTLLKLLNGVVSPSSGTLTYDDKHIEDYDPVTLRREVLLCGQSPYLFEGNVRDNFSQFYRYRELAAPEGDQMQAILKLCVVDFALEDGCATMSGGEQQRVFIAICLSFLPRVLLLDEPTSALDDTTAQTLMAGLKAFCAEHDITLVMVSHNSALVGAFADDLITLQSGGDKTTPGVILSPEARHE